jgi:hypothetical protein
MTFVKYNSRGFVFVSNLNRITADFDHPLLEPSDGYLLSCQYATPSALRLANAVLEKSKLLISDNGNFSRMKKIAAPFQSRCIGLEASARKQLARTGRISKKTQNQHRKLLKEVIALCDKDRTKTDWRSVVTKQLSYSPGLLIGLEDITIPTVHLAGLLSEVFGIKTKDLSRFMRSNTKSFLEGKNIQKQLVEKVRPSYLVIHAWDFDSGKLATRLSNKTRPWGFAISFGAAMASRRWVSSTMLGRRIVKYDKPIPEQYVLAHSTTLGVLAGRIGRLPVHILGVGSPILIALTCYLLRKQRFISFDSTAPYKDASIGTIYGDQSALLKMDMYKVAAYSVVSGIPFSSKAKCFKSFEVKYPADWSGLTRMLGITSANSVKQVAVKLAANDKLVRKYIPFFAKVRNDAFSKDLILARSGHNLKVLQDICSTASRLKAKPKQFENWLNFEVERYEKVASSGWLASIRAARALEKIVNPR